jgi:nucleotide-binding universal stress UspA family protein
MTTALKRIAVAYGGTDACRTALERGVALAQATGAALDLISVGIPIVPLGGFGWAAPYEDTHHVDRLVRERLDEAASLVEPGIEVRSHARIGSPAAEIVACAKETGADLLVLGAAHHGQLERLFVGSTANRVIRLSPVPCLVAATPRTARRILAAADESAFGEGAIHAALAVALSTGSEVRCVHVATAPPGKARTDETTLADLKAHFDRFVREAREGFAKRLEAGLRPPDVSVALRVGDVADEILAEASECDADLLAIGTHGRGFIARAFLGSMSEKLLERSPISVLVAPGPRAA